MICTHPNERPHYSFSLHPLAVHHEEQKHEEHHKVEDQNEHCQLRLLQSQPPKRSSEIEARNISSEEAPKILPAAFSRPASRSDTYTVVAGQTSIRLSAAWVHVYTHFQFRKLKFSATVLFPVAKNFQH